jgi:hypothetical protein
MEEVAKKRKFRDNFLDTFPNPLNSKMIAKFLSIGENSESQIHETKYHRIEQDHVHPSWS